MRGGVFAGHSVFASGFPDGRSGFPDGRSGFPDGVMSGVTCGNVAFWLVRPRVASSGFPDAVVDGLAAVQFLPLLGGPSRSRVGVQCVEDAAWAGVVFALDR